VEVNFFDLGGHSLLAAQIIHRLQRERGVRLSMRDFFDSPTIAAIATLVGASIISREAGGAQPLPAPPATDSPTAPNQERLWFLEQIDPGTTTYLLPGAWRWAGPLDHAALQAAFDALVVRHDVLRLAFVEVGGSPLLREFPEARLQLQHEDLSAIPMPERERVLQVRLEGLAQEPMTLDQAPLMRACLLRLAEDDHVLFVACHHIIWDGWSFDVFLADLERGYVAAIGAGAPLDRHTATFRAYAGWIREQRPEIVARELPFWREHLAGAPVLALPTDHARPAVFSSQGGFWIDDWDEAFMQRLERFARAHRATLHQVMLAGWSVLVSRLSGQEDFVVGSPVRGRRERRSLSRRSVAGPNGGLPRPCASGVRYLRVTPV
jgi:hypothetical protein